MRRATRVRSAVAGLVVVGLLGLCLGGCTWWKRFAYEGFGRDSWQQPDRVVSALGLKNGARVADLGSGGGYFTFRLAGAVGADGQVYAVDVDTDLLAYLTGRIEKEQHANVATVLASYDDPQIPEPVDLIFTCNTYHHLEDRPAYFRNAKSYLKPGGRVAVVEFKKQFLGHATDPAEIQSEMEAAGYELESSHGFLKRQSFLVFRTAD